LHQSEKSASIESQTDDDDSSTMKEQEDKAAELNEAKLQAIQNEQKRQEDAREEYFNKKFNVYDGTYHHEDGSRSFDKENKSTVGGANNYNQNDTKKA
jgi:hypothetical protein